MNKFEIVLLTGTFCSNCIPQKQRHKNASELLPNVSFKTLDVDSDEGGALVSALAVRGIPFSVVYKDGEVVYSKAGAWKEEDIVNKIGELE